MIEDVLQIANTGLTRATRAVDAYAYNAANVAPPSYPGANYPPSYDAQPPVYSPLNTGGAAVFTQDLDFADPNADPLTDVLGLMFASNQYMAAASLVDTGKDLSATLLQTIA